MGPPIRAHVCAVAATSGGASNYTDFSAHKCVLASYPSFLSAMIEAGMRESQQTTIDLHETDPQHFKLLLDYIYGKAIQIPSTDVIQVLGLASRYQVRSMHLPGARMHARPQLRPLCSQLKAIGNP